MGVLGLGDLCNHELLTLYLVTQPGLPTVGRSWSSNGGRVWGRKMIYSQPGAHLLVAGLTLLLIAW